MSAEYIMSGGNDRVILCTQAAMGRSFSMSWANCAGVMDWAPSQRAWVLAEHRAHFKPGALVADVCGVKSAILEAAKVLPDTVDFIGCHPMAGTEFSGIEHAAKTPISPEARASR